MNFTEDDPLYVDFTERFHTISWITWYSYSEHIALPFVKMRADILMRIMNRYEGGLK